MRDLAIKAEQLSYWYGAGDLRKQVLNDINVSIGQGEIVILTGPSGSGKTTLLTLIGCLRSAETGSLMVNGEEVVGAGERTLTKLRRRIGFIFQAHNLHRSLTAMQNVRMGLEVQGCSHQRGNLDKRACEILEHVGLADRIGHFPHELSGGQKQRVAVARALVSSPPLVLADEPTAALDSKSGRDVVNLLQRLAREQGTTILMVTHDNRILDVADRIVHIEDGLIKQGLVADDQSANVHSSTPVLVSPAP
ncbi:MAG: ATP-binding cassette domain-containing protein [Cyanobacteria bacterium SZAS LIN-3]|nr:ATP-binding cassette domain-containing protein [Cyanobacteria bacterium SZAS LIN-3]MBS2005609.1 ATP-binding cassette domain-containing protein [Cyanobacteria bacterium SZAS TMP-1]